MRLVQSHILCPAYEELGEADGGDDGDVEESLQPGPQGALPLLLEGVDNMVGPLPGQEDVQLHQLVD